MVVTLGQQYNVGEKPTVIMYTNINHHAQLPVITQHTVVHSYEDSTNVDNSTIEPYNCLYCYMYFIPLAFAH